MLVEITLYHINLVLRKSNVAKLWFNDHCPCFSHIFHLCLHLTGAAPRIVPLKCGKHHKGSLFVN